MFVFGFFSLFSKKEEKKFNSPGVEPLLNARRILGQVQILRDGEVGLCFVGHNVVDYAERMARNFGRLFKRVFGPSSCYSSTASFLGVHRRGHAPHLPDGGRVRPQHPQQHFAGRPQSQDFAGREEARAVARGGKDAGLVERAPAGDSIPKGSKGDLAPLDEMAEALVGLEAAADVVEPAV